jgi:hypothetical protein
MNSEFKAEVNQFRKNAYLANISGKVQQFFKVLETAVATEDK